MDDKLAGLTICGLEVRETNTLAEQGRISLNGMKNATLQDIWSDFLAFVLINKLRLVSTRALI